VAEIALAAAVIIFKLAESFTYIFGVSNLTPFKHMLDLNNITHSADIASIGANNG
jgi:hypothetical protein